MAKYHRKFAYEIYTPEGLVHKGDSFVCIFPAVDGEVGVLASRAPLVAALGAGRLEAEELEGRRLQWFLAGGFAQVKENLLTILAEQCIAADSLDATAAASELQAAHNMPAANPEERSRRAFAVRAASKKLAMARRQAAEKGSH
jgi:F-type H+-transporting ATPase subunit epsilon